MKKDFNAIRKFLLLLGLGVLISLASIRHWYTGGTFSFFWDSYVPLDIYNSFQHLYYYWHENIFPGFESAGWSWLLYWGLISGGQKVLMSLSLAQASLYILLLSSSIISFYYFAAYLSSKLFSNGTENKGLNVGIAAFAVMYTFNLFTFYYGYFMFNPDIFIFSFLPLNILALCRLFPLDRETQPSRSMRWFLTFFVTAFLMSPGFSVYVFMGQYYVWLTVYLFLYWFFVYRAVRRSGAVQVVSFLGLAILVNWWWLYPSLLGFKDLYNAQSVLGTTIWFERGFTPSRLLNSMRLIGIPLMMSNLFSWTGYFIKNSWFTFPLFVFPALIIFVIRKIGDYRHRLILFYLFGIYLVSLFLVKFSNPPLAWLTKFAFDYIPFFGAFRDSYQKAGVFYLFALFSIATVGYVHISALISSKGNRLLRVGFLTLVVCMFIVTTSPFFLFSYDNIRKISFDYNGKTHTISAKTKIPPEYSSAKPVLEEACKGTTIAVIPRSGWISSAEWVKYGTSYVGQDFLARTINCNFLTSVILNTSSEASIEAPYHMLQQADLTLLKQYLMQNKVGIVLLRKDYVPYFPTSWLHTDSARVRPMIEKDGGFEKFYENDFLAAYRLLPLKDDRNYGFSLTSTVVFTNATLTTGSQYAMLSRQVGDSSPFVTLTSEKEYLEQKNDINAFVPVLNCIGCVTIDWENYLANRKEPPLTQVKTVIKKLIGWKSKRTPEEALSFGLIEMHTEFLKLMDVIKDTDSDKARMQLAAYTKSLETLEIQLSSLTGDFFAVNQKNMEARHFLGVQYNILTDYLQLFYRREKPKKTVLDDERLRSQIVYISALQDDIYERLSSKIFATDFRKGIYRGRLDIPFSGSYACEVRSLVRGVQVNMVTLQNAVRESTVSGKFDPMELEKGSYPVSITYESAVRNFPSFSTEGESRKAKAALGNLDNGTYRLTFDYPSVLSGKFMVVISAGEISRSILSSNTGTDDFKRQIIFLDTPVSATLAPTAEYDHTFHINSLQADTYYLYLFPLERYSAENPVLAKEIKNSSVGSVIQEGDIEFSCSSRKEAPPLEQTISVTKLSPTHYRMYLTGEKAGNHLIFNQTYSYEWQATAMVNGKEHVFPHARSGYANSWLLNNRDARIIDITYRRQRLIEKSALISTVMLVLAILMYIRVYKIHE